MAKFSLHFLTLAFLLTLDIALGAPIKSCRQTPHPQVCTSMLSSERYHRHHSKSPLEFRNLVLKATLDRAIHAHRLASTRNIEHLHSGAKAAWTDCLEFYDDIIEHINKSMSPSASRSDTNAWLSAALTQYDSCKDGFAEMKSLSKYRSSPFSDNNISGSISNALAIDNALPPTRRSSNKKRDNWFLAQEFTEGAPHIVVEKGGKYDTISKAIDAVPQIRNDDSRFIIQVKAGIYEEHVVINKTKALQNITMIGEGMYKTVVTGSKSHMDGVETYHTATFTVLARGFVAKEMTFDNTAGALKGQAVALLSQSDVSVFYRCRFLSYQDTLYVKAGRQFYRECEIHGTIDFIFGNAAAIFQYCTIFLQLPPDGKTTLVITAQGRQDQSQKTGIIIQKSTILPTEELKRAQEKDQNKYKIYLGRPWKKYSRTIIMTTKILCNVHPDGWLPWESQPENNETAYYAEYRNEGPGSNTLGRVHWPHYQVFTDVSDARKYKLGRFFDKDYKWIQDAGVPVEAHI